jgi:hypothetical protein
MKNKEADKLIEKSRAYKAFLFLALTTFATTGVQWLPHYVAFFSPQVTRFYGSLANYQKSCDQAQTETMVCRESYLIPSGLWKSLPIDKPSIGFGILLPATQINCSNKDSSSIHFGDLNSDSDAQATFQTYETADLTTLNCKGDASVSVWASKVSFAKFGYIGGPLVVGEAATISLIKKSVEFFTTQFYFLIAIWTAPLKLDG